MAGFVFAHFVYGVVHGVVSEFLSPLCEHELAFGRAPFGFDSQLQILLGVGIYAFSEEFRELCGVFCLFKGYSFVRFRDFRISLSAWRLIARYIPTSVHSPVKFARRPSTTSASSPAATPILCSSAQEAAGASSLTMNLDLGALHCGHTSGRLSGSSNT